MGHEMSGRLFCLAMLLLTNGTSVNCTAQVVTTVVTRINPNNRHAYSVLAGNDGISWLEAEQAANNLGGHLATIRSASEGDWIANNFKDFAFLWIGLNDQAQEGSFIWSSGEPVTYTNWFSGEPNNFGGDEHFAQLYTSVNLWNDDDFDRRAQGSPIYGLAEVIDRPGDFDDDSDVDGADFVMWQRELGAFNVPFAGADGDGNGTVNADDLVGWRESFGTIYSGTPALVPEPSTLPVLMLFVIVLGSRLSCLHMSRRSPRSRLSNSNP